MKDPLSEIARALEEGDRDRVVALTDGAITAPDAPAAVERIRAMTGVAP